jgi:hypothetical protein
MGVETKLYLIPRRNDFRPTAQQLTILIDSLVQGNFLPNPSSIEFHRMSYEYTNLSHHAAASGAIWLRFRQNTSSFVVPPPANALGALESGDHIIRWPVENLEKSGLASPVDADLDFEEGPFYYDFELHLSDDYVYHTSEIVEPFDNTDCACGQSLEMDPEGEALASEPDKSGFVNRLLKQIGLASKNEIPHINSYLFYAQRIMRTCSRCGTQFTPQSLKAAIVDGMTGEEEIVDGGASYRFAIVLDFGKALNGYDFDPFPGVTTSLKSICEASLGETFYTVFDSY